MPELPQQEGAMGSGEDGYPQGGDAGRQRRSRCGRSVWIYQLPEAISRRKDGAAEGQGISGWA